MASIINEATIKIRRDTAGNWTSNNPTPAEGEWCLETDTKYTKIGDGSTAWTALAYQPSNADVAAKLTGTTAQICKAWVNFTSITTTVIADDFNVTSLTDNAAGDTTINFTNNMTDTKYAVSGSGSTNVIASGARVLWISDTTKAVGSVRVFTAYAGLPTTGQDMAETSVQIFGS